LTGIVDHHWQLAIGQRRGDDHFIDASRLEDDSLWPERTHPFDQGTQTGWGTVRLPVVGGGADGDVELGLTDIDADPGRDFSHRSIRAFGLSNPARPCRCRLAVWPR
jgi:hypothetical protein